MINFFICSYFEGHWIINTKKNKKQNPNFLRVEYYLIRESPTSVFWSQTSVRVDVHTCEMWWYLVLPPPHMHSTPSRTRKGATGQTSNFLAGSSFPAGPLGGVDRSACRLLPFPSAFLLGPPSPPLVLAFSFSSFFLFPTSNSHKAPNKPSANIKTVQLFSKDDQGKVSSLKRHLYLLSH